MPELPDVEAYCTALKRVARGARLEWIVIDHPFLLRSVTTPPDEAVGATVTDVARSGKRIVVSLDNNVSVAIHLMIAGRLKWQPTDQPPPAPPRRSGGGRSPVLAKFGFSTGILTLTEAGSRRRASLHVVRPEELRAITPNSMELLAPDASPARFAELLRRENHTIKRALTDPRLFSGIGNSYSDEILFAARMSPFAMTQSLSDEEIETLFLATVDTLRGWRDRFAALAQREFPSKVTAFMPEMNVHGRYGQPCTVCGTPVQRIRYAENECNYCARCQTGGRVYADRALSRLLKSDWPRTVEELEKLGKAPG